MANREVLDQLQRLLHNRPNLSAEGGDALFQQFAQPIFDRRQEQRDLEQQQAMADEEQRKMQLADLQSMLTGAAMEQGTLAPQQVRQQAISYGAEPVHARQMAQMVAPAGPAGMDDQMDPEDMAGLPAMMAAASQGIPPLQLASGSPAEATGQPVPKEVVLSQLANLLRAEGKGPGAIAQAVAAVSSGYRY